ncbi:MAG: site-specific integrase [Bacilli bacterium]|nr:site-specific integrase [Bacilli bacterium]
MTIEKRSENSWRVKQMYKGKYYYASFDHKPSQKECTLALADAMDNGGDPTIKGTFKAAYEKYVQSKSNVLSPTTIRGYESVIKNMSDDFKNTPIADITAAKVQQEINAYCMSPNGKIRSPKTVRNCSGLISAVLSVAKPNLALNTTLPQKKKNEDHIPTDEEVEKILKAVEGTKYHLPFMLAICSLRRSEICALTPADLKGNQLTIDKSYVQDKDNNWIIKPYNKTEASSRTITLPDKVAEEYREITTERIFMGFPGTLYRNLKKLQDQFGIEHFRFHTLRAYYASFCHSIGIPDAYIMKMGGWESDAIMKSVYRRTKSDTEKKMDNLLSEKISGLF